MSYTVQSITLDANDFATNIFSAESLMVSAIIETTTPQLWATEDASQMNSFQDNSRLATHAFEEVFLFHCLHALH